MVETERKLVVCYIPGLDRRRISDAATPNISKLISQYGSVEIRTIPDTELVPTLLSGVYPHQNKIWQVSVDARHKRTLTQRIIDALPNLLTTTAQCIWQRFNPNFDLAAIPPRRRREFTQHRFKYTRRIATPEIMRNFNGYETVFGVLGQDAQYRFTHRFDTLDSLAREIVSSSLRFEFLEMYALDLFQHWHLDDDVRMRDALAMTDNFVASLIDGCARNGQTLVLLSDHGQELVTGTIPLVRMLQESGAHKVDYSYYSELASARLWFNSDQARTLIIPKLQRLPNCTLLHFSEMHQYDVCFDDASFGEYYLLADAGYVFFPHDFYQPLASLYLGLFGHSQRSRVLNPVHRGNHGYLPHYPSEKGFLVLADDQMKPNREHMTLVDVAPTMLTCLGAKIPAHMTGQSVV